MIGVLLVAAICFGGWGIARLLTEPSGSKTAVEVAAAPGLGLGFFSLGYFFVVHFGLPKTLVGALLAVLVLGPFALGRLFPASSTKPDEARELVDPPGFFHRTTPISLRIALGFVATAVGLSLFAMGWARPNQHPYGGFDSIAIWNAHAVFLHRVDEGQIEVYRQLERGHPEYPLLVPGAVAACFDLLGRESRSVPYAMAFLMVAGTVLFVYVGVARLGSRTLAFPAALTVAAWPVIPKHAFSLAADIWVSYYALAAAVGLWGLLPDRTDDRPPVFRPIFPGLCLGFLAWTKNEGAVLAALLGGLFFLYTLWGPRLRSPDVSFVRALRQSTAVAAWTIPSAIALVLFRLHWVSAKEAGAFLSDLGAKVTDLERWGIIASGLVGQLIPLRPGNPWGLFWIFAAAGIVLALRRPWGPRRAFLITAFVAATGIYMSFFLISPYDLVWHVAQSIQRLLMQLTPLFVVWLFSSLDFPRETSRSSDPPTSEGSSCPETP